MRFIRKFCAIILFLAVITPFSVQIDAEGAEGDGKDSAGQYVVNLLSSAEPINPSELPPLDIFPRYRLYAIVYREDGKTWHRLRMGFFSTWAGADEIRQGLKKVFPEVWVAKVSRKEVLESAKHEVQVAIKAAPVPEKPAPRAVPEKPAPAPARAEELMEKAARAMTEGDYSKAIALYSAVLREKDGKYAMEALELLALAREKKGEIAKAVSDYRKYLSLYPKGEGAERVRQRLAGLETAEEFPKERLKKTEARKAETTVYGSFSQFYNRSENFTGQGPGVINRSSVSNDLDLNVRKKSELYETRFAFSGGYEFDLLDGENETRLSQLYFEGIDRWRFLSGRFGRQNLSTGGVLGRFDGALVSYRLISRIKANVVGGFPVESSVFEKFSADRRFIGANLDIGPLFESLDFNVFFINQIASGMTDRRAAGLEARYFRPERSLLALFDYDLFYSAVNTALLTGSWTFKNETTLNASVDYRKSPVLTTTNALIGQSVGSLDDLNATYSEEEIRELARDRTPVSRSLMIGASRPINKKFQVNGDLTVSSLSSTPASGGVEASEGTGVEYFLSTQLVGSSLLKEGDVTIFGLRYADSSGSNTAGFNLNSRYPVSRSWRINPRFGLDYIFNRPTGDELKVRPALRTDYNWGRTLRLEFEGGVEWSNLRADTGTESSLDYFLTAGYRLDF